MLLLRASMALAFFAALAAFPALGANTSVHPASTNSQTKHSTHRRTVSRSRRPRGQQGIESSRVMEIQQALMRVHYLSGEPTGQWDERTKAAMQKYQADQGWQTKLLPDSRALKMLGLGPDYSNAINAKNSSFATPPPSSTTPPEQAAGFVEASGVSTH